MAMTLELLGKRCSKCGEIRPFADFARLAQSSDGLRPDCTPCRLRWYAANGDRLRARRKEQYDADPEPHIAAVRRWQKRNPGKVRAADRERYAINRSGRKERQRLRKYGLTIEEYNFLRWKQNDTCPICVILGQEPVPLRGQKLVIDHDHATGKVRGLLCAGHNAALGHCKDSPAALRALADYLEAANCAS